MADNDYSKILSGLHDKILKDEEMLQKVDHSELYALGMSKCLFDFQMERLEQWKEEANKYQTLWCDAVQDIQTAKSEAIREFAEKITEVFLRYAHLHNYAEKSRTETIESAEGEKIEMQSVWDVLSLKKYEMAEYEEMSELQKNIEIIAKERLLTELEKDFRLLKKEMVGDE